MKYIIRLCLMLMLIVLTSCEIIGEIFSAGVYTGIFVVVLVVAILIWIISRLGKRG
jgi:hypothetical protein